MTMARVFISYARADWELASRLREWLVGDRHEVFQDVHVADGIHVGEQWEEQIHDRLMWADAMVGVVTSAYVSSPWCSAEIAIFRWKRGGWLLPINAEQGVEHPLLRSVHGADYARDPAGSIVAVLKSLRDLEAKLLRRRPSDGVRLVPDRAGHRTLGGSARVDGIVEPPAAVPD